MGKGPGKTGKARIRSFLEHSGINRGRLFGQDRKPGLDALPVRKEKINESNRNSLGNRSGCIPNPVRSLAYSLRDLLSVWKHSGKY